MNYKKLSKVANLQATNYIKDSDDPIFHKVDYNFDGIYNYESDVNGVFSWETDDNQLILCTDSSWGIDIAVIWKVAHREEVAFTCNSEKLVDLLHSEEFLESMADFNGVSVEEVKKELQELLDNFYNVVEGKAKEIAGDYGFSVIQVD